MDGWITPAIIIAITALLLRPFVQLLYNRHASFTVLYAALQDASRHLRENERVLLASTHKNGKVWSAYYDLLEFSDKNPLLDLPTLSPLPPDIIPKFHHIILNVRNYNAACRHLKDIDHAESAEYLGFVSLLGRMLYEKICSLQYLLKSRKHHKYCDKNTGRECGCACRLYRERLGKVPWLWPRVISPAGADTLACKDFYQKIDAFMYDQESHPCPCAEAVWQEWRGNEKTLIPPPTPIATAPQPSRPAPGGNA